MDYALQAEGPWFESMCSHPQNQPLTIHFVSGFFLLVPTRVPTFRYNIDNERFISIINFTFVL